MSEVATRSEAELEGDRLERLRVLTRIMVLVRPYRGRVALSVGSLLIGSGLSLLYPQAARYAVDIGMNERSAERLDQIALAFLGLVVLQAVLVWVRHFLMSWIGERAVTDLRTRVYEHLLSLSSVWFHARRSGEVVGRLASDVTVIAGVVGSELSFALRNAVQLLGGIILLFTVDARLTFTALGVVPPVVLGAVVFGRILRRKSRLVQDHLADASAQVQESIGAIQTVQAFLREPHELERYQYGVERAFDEAVSLARWRASFFSSVTVGGYCAVVCILWLGGRRVIAGELSPGSLVAFLLYTFTVAGGLVSMANLWGSLQRAGGATLRLFDILETEPEIRDPAEPLELPNRGGQLRLQDVHFAYPSAPEHPGESIRALIAGARVKAIAQFA